MKTHILNINHDTILGGYTIKSGAIGGRIAATGYVLTTRGMVKVFRTLSKALSYTNTRPSAFVVFGNISNIN